MRVEVRIFVLLFGVAVAGVIPEQHLENGIQSGDVAPRVNNVTLEETPAVKNDTQESVEDNVAYTKSSDEDDAAKHTIEDGSSDENENQKHDIQIDEVHDNSDDVLNAHSNKTESDDDDEDSNEDSDSDDVSEHTVGNGNTGYPKENDKENVDAPIKGSPTQHVSKEVTSDVIEHDKQVSKGVSQAPVDNHNIQAVANSKTPDSYEAIKQTTGSNKVVDNNNVNPADRDIGGVSSSDEASVESDEEETEPEADNLIPLETILQALSDIASKKRELEVLKEQEKLRKEQEKKEKEERKEILKREKERLKLEKEKEKLEKERIKEIEKSKKEQEKREKEELKMQEKREKEERKAKEKQLKAEERLLLFLV